LDVETIFGAGALLSSFGHRNTTLAKDLRLHSENIWNVDLPVTALLHYGYAAHCTQQLLKLISITIAQECGARICLCKSINLLWNILNRPSLKQMISLNGYKLTTQSIKSRFDPRIIFVEFMKSAKGRGTNAVKQAEVIYCSLRGNG